MSWPRDRVKVGDWIKVAGNSDSLGNRLRGRVEKIVRRVPANPALDSMLVLHAPDTSFPSEQYRFTYFLDEVEEIIDDPVELLILAGKAHV